MLPAEELVLLALDDDGELVDGNVLPATSMAITGALIDGLEQDGHLELDENLAIHLTGTRPVHAALAAELDHLVPLEGQRLGTRLVRTSHAAWDDVVDGLVATGVLRREKRPLRQASHPQTDPATRAALLAEVQAAAISRTPPDDEMQKRLAFLSATGLGRLAAAHEAVVPGVRRRLEAALDAVPLAQLCRDATNSKPASWIGAPGGPQR